MLAKQATVVHESMYAMGRRLQSDGQLLAALSHFLAAAALEPARHDYVLSAAKMHLELGEIASARDLYAHLRNSRGVLPPELAAEFDRDAALADATEIRNWRTGARGWERTKESIRSAAPASAAASVQEQGRQHALATSGASGASSQPASARAAGEQSTCAASAAEASPSSKVSTTSAAEWLEQNVGQHWGKPRKHSIMMSVSDLGMALEDLAPNAAEAPRLLGDATTSVREGEIYELSSRTDEPSVRSRRASQGELPLPAG